MILASAFSSIVVYAQELLPGRVGMVSGLMFGFAFGVGGVGAGALGQLADQYGVEAVYQWCAWLPLLGVRDVAAGCTPRARLNQRALVIAGYKRARPSSKIKPCAQHGAPNLWVKTGGAALRRRESDWRAESR